MPAYGQAELHYSDEQVEITRIVVGPLVNNVFVIRCTETGDAVLVDAADESAILLDLCRRLDVGDVLTTHSHSDHVQAVPAVRRAGHRVGVGPADAPTMPEYDFEIADDEVIEVGRLRIRALHTPGHTPGSTCFTIEGSPVLLSGDTLFPGGPGNTRRNTVDFATIIRSVQQRLFTLPDDTIVMPGHGDDTTIGTERPHLQEWIDRGW